jgi:hypothetical protein
MLPSTFRYSVLTTVFLTALVFRTTAQVCNAAGRIMIYSNYDGGIVTINIDQNIPNLKIGICTYEPVQVTFTGPFVGNIVQVRYAGFNSNQNNNNCGQGNFTTSIAGVPPGIVSILTAPPATLSDPDGWPQIVCGVGSCNPTGSTGGCNTPEQIVAYFESSMGGDMYGHFTQYQCWLNETLFLSEAGTCCIDPSAPSDLPPTVECPSPVTLNSEPGMDYAFIPDLVSLAVVTDDNPGVTVTQTPMVGSQVENGDIVIITAEDAAGNLGSCSVSVVVIEVPDEDCCVGDFNCDGIVNVADLGIIISQFSCSGCFADLDQDGLVTVLDLNIFSGLFGWVCP